MPKCRLFAAVMFLASLWFCGEAAAQPRPPEYLRIDNPNDLTSWVYLRARGGEVQNPRWQAGETVAAGKRRDIRLRGYQPFDILILSDDGAYLQFDQVNLCSLMDLCRLEGIKAAELEATFGRWYRDDRGQTQLRPSQGTWMGARTVPADMDYTLVRIEVPRPPRRR